MSIHRAALETAFRRALRNVAAVQKASSSQFRRRIAEGQLVESIGALARQAELSLHGLRQRELWQCYSPGAKGDAKGDGIMGEAAEDSAGGNGAEVAGGNGAGCTAVGGGNDDRAAGRGDGGAPAGQDLLAT